MAAGGSAALLASAILASVLGATHEGPGVRPPIRNLRMEAAARRLTWERDANVSGLSCRTGDGHFQRATADAFCSYAELLPLCSATNYTVSAEEPPFSASIVFPEQAGDPAAGATGLSCWVRDGGRGRRLRLSCRWAAPDGARTRAFLRLPSGRLRECVRYEPGPGCHFGLDSAEAALALVSVVVNGSAQGAALPCAEFAARARDIERLRPPALSLRCPLLRWPPPRSRFSASFVYSLRVRKDSEAEVLIEDVEANSWELPGPGAYAVRIRAAAISAGAHSPWGPERSFACGPEEAAPWRPRLAAALSALGTLAAALGAGLLCRRLAVLPRLCPPVPRVREPAAPALALGRPLASVEAEDCPVLQVRELDADSPRPGAAGSQGRAWRESSPGPEQ